MQRRTTQSSIQLNFKNKLIKNAFLVVM